MKPSLLHLTNVALLASSTLACSVAFAAGEAATPDDERLEPGQTVADRAQPEYAPLGIRVGTFILYPDARLTETYDDNLYFQSGATSDDFITTFAPSARLVSDWSNHQLEFGVNAELIRHADHSAEDMDNYDLSGKGTLDISRDTDIKLLAAWSRDHEGRGSANAVNGTEPTPVDTGELALKFRHEPGRFFVRGGLAYTDLSFDNVLTSTGATINNGDRNREETEVSVTVGYEIQPQYAAFLRYIHDERDYSSALDDNGFNRDSTGDRIEVGVELDMSGLVTGEVSLGYMERDYADAAFANTDDWSFAADLYWQVTPLTTLVFGGTRAVMESTLNNSSGFVNTGLSVRGVHELRRNLILDATLSTATHAYEGVGREDDLYDVSFSATYDVTREVYLGASYAHNQRDSSAAGFDYDRNAFSVFVGLRR